MTGAGIVIKAAGEMQKCDEGQVIDCQRPWGQCGLCRTSAIALLLQTQQLTMREAGPVRNRE